MTKNNLFYLLLAIGFAVRFFQLGSIPAEGNFDEQFYGYEAFSMVNYGYASNGSHNPIFFDAAGNAQQSAYIYLSMLPVKIFGLSFFSERITAAVIGCLSLLIFYLFTKKITSKEIALLSLFLLAINPWNIMMSRYGFAPSVVYFFGLAGSYFLYKGIENSKFLIVSALFFGFGFYALATAWITFPFIILFFGAYCIYTKKVKISKQLILHASIAGFILILFGIPNVLFLLVNNGMMSEIRGNFITIPKLLDQNTAGNVFSFDVIENILLDFKYYIFDQSCWTMPVRGFGIFYLFSTPFIIIGFVSLMSGFIKKLKMREFYAPAVPLFQIFGSVFVILYTFPGVSYHHNLLFIPAIYCCAHGIALVSYRKAIVAFYSIVFCFFIFTYWNAPKQIQGVGGYQSAVTKATQSDAAKVFVFDMEHPQFLAASKYPTDKLIHDVEYDTIPYGSSESPRFFLSASRIGHYYFMVRRNSYPIVENAVYIYNAARHVDVTNTLSQAGFDIEVLEQFVFAKKDKYENTP